MSGATLGGAGQRRCLLRRMYGVWDGLVGESGDHQVLRSKKRWREVSRVSFPSSHFQ